MARNKVLVVDDEPGVRFGIRDFLEQQGYEIEEADSCEDAQHLFRTSRPDIVIADYMLPDGTALDLIPRLKEIDSDIPLLVLTAHGSIDLAVRAIKEGAEQFLTKPLELPAWQSSLRDYFKNSETITNSWPAKRGRLDRQSIPLLAPVQRSGRWQIRREKSSRLRALF